MAVASGVKMDVTRSLTVDVGTNLSVTPYRAQLAGKLTRNHDHATRSASLRGQVLSLAAFTPAEQLRHFFAVHVIANGLSRAAVICLSYPVKQSAESSVLKMITSTSSVPSLPWPARKSSLPSLLRFSALLALHP